MIYDHPDTAAIIDLALREDLGAAGDITCRAVVPPDARLAGRITAKESGVLCGMALFQRVCDRVGAGVVVTDALADGTTVAPGTLCLRFQGPAAVLLQAERTALNLAQRLSGTATLARTYADVVAGTRARVFDTRKTTPGLRLLQKHAVVAGGGANHRIGLYDQVLLKENHIALMGAAGPAEAVRRARAATAPGTVIEVEIERLDDLEGVITASADIVLLDNMDPDLCRRAVAVRDRLGMRCDLEASGGITLTTIRAFAEAGVERISVGALTHSAACLDLSMRCDPVA
ncbi:MAG: Nicotinate-nucleotide pyrophosphorylase [Planctomycetota bacterium]|jgi:nicotinate-nucleotide pyrophosphorylase (carboxylating)